jgi:hypothetical protein
VIKTCCVPCNAGTEFLNIILTNFILQGVKGTGYEDADWINVAEDRNE